MKPKVLLSLPHMGSHHVGNSNAVMRLVQDSRVELAIIRPTAVPYENNLNQVIKTFLDGDYDYWLNIDEDNEPKRNPLDLIALDKDVIGCIYPSLKMGFEKPGETPFFWSCYDWTPEGYRPHRPQTDGPKCYKVDAISSGCMLVARRVLAAVKQPLLRRYDADGIVTMGCDLSFCTKVREAGFSNWIHLDYPCEHYKTVGLLKILEIDWGGATHG